MLRLGRCRAESLDAAGDVPQRRFLERLGGSYGHGCAACERQQGSRPQGGGQGGWHEDQGSLHLNVCFFLPSQHRQHLDDHFCTNQWLWGPRAGTHHGWRTKGGLGWLWKSGNHTRNKGRCAPSFSILHTCIILYHCLSVYRLLYVLLLKGWKVWGCHQMQLPKRWENPKSGMKLHFSWFNRYTPRGKLCCASWGPWPLLIQFSPLSFASLCLKGISPWYPLISWDFL